MSFTMFPDDVGSVRVTPRTLKMFSTDNYATITTAGYINKSSLPDMSLYPTDWIQASFGGGNAFFNPTFDLSTGIITLAEIFPTSSAGGTTGHLVSFGANGTFVDSGLVATSVITTTRSLGTATHVVTLGGGGVLADSGFPLSSASAIVSITTQANASTIGHIPTYSTITGTLTDSGLSPSTVAAAGTSAGSAGDAAHCAAPDAWPIMINGVQYYIPLFIQNT